jgi:hypothetical protein
VVGNFINFALNRDFISGKIIRKRTMNRNSSGFVAKVALPDRVLQVLVEEVEKTTMRDKRLTDRKEEAGPSMSI